MRICRHGIRGNLGLSMYFVLPCIMTLLIANWAIPSRFRNHYDDVIMDAIASQITSLTIVYSSVYSDQSKHQSSASLAFVWGIHRGPVNSPHNWPVTGKMFPFDDVIMMCTIYIENKDPNEACYEYRAWSMWNLNRLTCRRCRLNKDKVGVARKLS